MWQSNLTFQSILSIKMAQCVKYTAHYNNHNSTHFNVVWRTLNEMLVQRKCFDVILNVREPMMICEGDI
jgi:hypothetical protein